MCACAGRLTSVEVLGTVACGSGGRESSGLRRGEEIHGKGAPSLQPRLHPDLLDPAPGVRKPGGELRQVHAAVVSQVLLLCLRRVRIRLVLLDPLNEHGSVAHPPDGVLLLQRRARDGFVSAAAGVAAAGGRFGVEVELLALAHYLSTRRRGAKSTSHLELQRAFERPFIPFFFLSVGPSSPSPPPGQIFDHTAQ